MSITITQTAAKHVNEHLMSRGTGIGLRLGVKTTGCSGLAYVTRHAQHFIDIESGTSSNFSKESSIVTRASESSLWNVRDSIFGRGNEDNQDWAGLLRCEPSR